jgi:ABC-type transport system involved in multi-copper enzyme maturation permease subunit
MKRLWLMTALTIKDSLRTLVWIPFAVGIIAANLMLLGGFGYRLVPNPYASNIISSHFMIFSAGIYFSGIALGATSMPRERRARVMFTLPISRTEIVLGKLLGNQIVVGLGLLAGYLISLCWALYFDLTGFTHSWLGLAVAFSLSFTYLCLTIPLGYWMPAVPAALVAWLIVNVPSTLKLFSDNQVITANWLVQSIEILASLTPGHLDAEPLSKAFYNLPVFAGDYVGVLTDVLLALAFFTFLSALGNRKELSTKSQAA